MPGRIDYHDDPDAPAANSLVPSANAVVVDHAGQVLLIRRADNGNWALPGGGMQIGESLPAAAVREVAEETGIQVEITGLVGIYTDPRHVIAEVGSSQVRQECSVVFTARALGGRPRPSDESSDVCWVPPETVASLQMDPAMRTRITDYLTGGDLPHLG